MSSRIRTTEELRAALKQKLDKLRDAFKADVVTLHLYDPQRERLYFPVGVNLLQERRFMQGVPSMERGAGKIVRSRAPIIAEDVEHHPDLTGPFTHVEKTKSAAGFPLFVPDSRDVMGVLFVDYRRAHKFEEDETERTQSWASEIAEFISRSLQGDQGQMLWDALRRETDLRLEETRLQELVNRLWDILGDIDIALWTQERGKRDLRIKMYAGMDRDFVERVSVNPDTDSSNIVSVAFVDGKEVLIESPKDDPRATFGVAAPITWERMLAVPVSSEYHRLGVLCVFRRERLGFTRRERDLVRVFANLIAVTIENEERIIALNTLHDVGVRLTLATDLSEILQEVVRSACQVIGADGATVHLYDPARQEFHDVEHSAFFPPEARSGAGKPRGKGGLGVQIVEQGRVYCEDIDTQTDAITHSSFVRRQGIKAYVGTRLTSIDEPLGVLYVNFKEKRRFSPEDLSLIQLLANYASTAIYRARLLDQRTAVTEIARDIASELDRDVLLQKILERSLKLLDCQAGSIALLNRATGELEFQYAIGKDVGIRLPVDKGLMTMAAQTQQPVRVGDVTRDPRYFEHVEETRSELDVPLLVGDELVGVLNAESPRYNAFSEEDGKLATTLASQAAVALYNAALFERRKALVDFGQAVTSGICLREAEVLEFIHKQASRVMDTANMYIALYDDLTDTVRFGLAFMDGKYIDVGTDERWQPRKAGKGKTEHIIHTKMPLFHATEAEAKTWYALPKHKEYLGTLLGASWLGVPMMVGEKVLGVIATYHPSEYVYSGDDLEILQAMANQAAIAVDNARLTYGLEQVVEERTRQLREAQEKALAAEVNAAVGLVTAEVAHHSKNLAGIIRSCAIRLRRQLHDLTPQQQEDLGNILLNSEGILRSAEDLFNPFRPEPKAEISVDLMLREALGVLGRLPDIDIQVNLASDLPKVTVQVQKVTSYITELLNNAVKFTRERMKEKRIDQAQIEVGGRLAEDGFVELTFTNHGPVIPREHWKEIFKLFSAREEEAQEARSYGLGLWGARTTMRAHGGDVYVLESNEERTIFLLRLPTRQQGG